MRAREPAMQPAFLKQCTTASILATLKHVALSSSETMQNRISAKNPGGRVNSSRLEKICLSVLHNAPENSLSPAQYAGRAARTAQRAALLAFRGTGTNRRRAEASREAGERPRPVLIRPNLETGDKTFFCQRIPPVTNIAPLQAHDSN